MENSTRSYPISFCFTNNLKFSLTLSFQVRNTAFQALCVTCRFTIKKARLMSLACLASLVRENYEMMGPYMDRVAEVMVLRNLMKSGYYGGHGRYR